MGREKQTQQLTEEKGRRSGGRERQERGTEKREAWGKGTIKAGEKRGGRKRSESKRKLPRNPEKRETQGNPDSSGRGSGAEESFSPAPRPSAALRGPRPVPRAPRPQRAPGQVRQSAAQWVAPGPPPRSLIGRFRAGLALLTSSLGSGGPTRSRLVRPGARPARRRQQRARPGAPELAFWSGAGGARGTARGARAPGAPRGRPRSQPARSPCLAARPSCSWRGGPALHGPGC